MYVLQNNFKKLTALIQVFVIFIIITSLGYAYKDFEKPFLKIEKQESAFNFNSKFLSIISLGNKRFLSDLLWVQTLLESDLEHYKKRNLNSWIYLRLKTITEIDPLFLEAYYFGGQYLSVIKDDIIGASTIYNKGLKYFPDDYGLNYAAGLHFYLEEGDNQKAIQCLDKIKNNPRAPAILTSILARLNMEENHLENAYLLLLEQIKQFNPDSRLYKKTWTNLYSIRAEIDLECLNSKSSIKKCNTSDIEQTPYVKLDGVYQAQKDWIPFKLKKMTNN